MEERKLPAHIVCAAGIVLNERGEVLLVKDNRRGWIFPGGIVENGEDPIQGLLREINEETGIEAGVGELFCVSSDICTYEGYNGVKLVPTKLILDFICRRKSGEPRPSEENGESAFVPVVKARELIKSGSYKERFEAYLAYDGRPLCLSFRTRPEFELLSKIRI